MYLEELMLYHSSSVSIKSATFADYNDFIKNYKMNAVSSLNLIKQL